MLFDFKIPGNRWDDGEQTHFVGFSIHHKSCSGIKIHICFIKDKEGIFLVIEVVNREVEAGFKMFSFNDIPVYRNIQTMVWGHSVSISIAVFRDHVAIEEIITHRNRHGVAAGKNPNCRDGKFIANHLEIQIDGHIVAAVIFCPKPLLII